MTGAFHRVPLFNGDGGPYVVDPVHVRLVQLFYEHPRVCGQGLYEPTIPLGEYVSKARDDFPEPERPLTAINMS